MVLNIVIGIIGLSFLVLFHETGHFVAAKIFGVKVLSFSVGMGPVLLHKEFKGTDFRLSLIPLGGYCGMKGEQDFDVENYQSFVPDKDSFYGVAPFKRLLIAFAGPFFNLFLGFVFFMLISAVGYTYYSPGTKVLMADEVYPEMRSQAHEAGLLSGDVILKVNGKDVTDFLNFREIIATNPDKDLVITVNRNEEILSFTVHTDLDLETGAGLIGVVSDSQSVEERVYKASNIFEAFYEGGKKTGNFISATFTAIGTLFKGVKITNAVSGPARITTMLGESVKTGFNYGIKTGIITAMELLAYISISLFITNLLPLPVLDGGLIIFALIQIITRKRLNPKILKYIQYAGIVLIALMFMLAILGDVQYFIKK